MGIVDTPAVHRPDGSVLSGQLKLPWRTEIPIARGSVGQPHAWGRSMGAERGCSSAQPRGHSASMQRSLTQFVLLTHVYTPQAPTFVLVPRPHFSFNSYMRVPARFTYVIVPDICIRACLFFVWYSCMVVLRTAFLCVTFFGSIVVANYPPSKNTI